MDIKDKMQEAIHFHTFVHDECNVGGTDKAAESCAKIAEDEKTQFAHELLEWLTVYESKLRSNGVRKKGFGQMMLTIQLLILSSYSNNQKLTTKERRYETI